MARPGTISRIAFQPDLYSSMDGGPGIIAAAALAGLAIWGSSTGWNAAFCITFAIYAGAVGGFLIGGYRTKLSHDWVAVRCGLQAEDFRNIGGDIEFKEGQFLTLCAGAITLYLSFYGWAANSFAASMTNKSDLPIPPLVVAITAVMVFASSAICVRYAAYMRMATMLKAALDNTPPPDARIVLRLHKSVFRMEQIYEPPGNVFVTIGITATFLGLAVGLVTLDMFSFFPIDGESTSDQALRSAKAISSLRAFVGCMGLALGLSMLGVLTSMFAQWLRGYGPSASTEDVLHRAACFEEGVADGHGNARRATESGQRGQSQTGK